MTSAKIGMDIAASKVSELKKEYDSRKVEQLERDRADKFSNMTLKELIAEGLSALKESDFQRAEELFDHALATNPKNANAYIGKLMVKHKVRNANELVSVNVLIEEDELFQSAMKLANPKMKELLEKYVTVNRAKVSGKRLGKNS